MKKSFDINVTTYQAQTIISIIEPNRIHFFAGEEIKKISLSTGSESIKVNIEGIELECSTGWEWNKMKDLLLVVLPDQKTLHWHKKKFPGHPCYQDFSK